jgi:4-alpha-glucanotransferase
VRGRWVKGPGAAFFQALQGALGEALPIVAENLGVITPEVEALRRRFGFPGMAILQFAFGSDSQANEFLPHNHTRDLVVYTGTHDNDTIVGWWTSAGAADSTRTAAEVERERDSCRRYFATDGSQIHWDFVRAAQASVARRAVVPVQDLLGLGTEARMNLPGRAADNWGWRLAPGQLTGEAGRRLRELTELYGRRR